jgi:peptidoglycan/xylan/chitin deacetylase (PgdA/CDA1 family)
VSDTWPDELSVRPDALERQLRHLIERGYRPAAALDSVTNVARSLHVTFDDAYKSVANALPVLERLGVQATVFACADYADDGRPLDVPELARPLATHAEEMATMTWDELRDLIERGIEIGSHTLTHPHLPRLSDGELDIELGASRERFEDTLARPCRLLAYPYGEEDERVRVAARRAGYEAAFAIRPTAPQPDIFAIPRTDLYRRDGPVRARLKTSLVPRLPGRLLEAFDRMRGKPGARAARA